MKQTDTFFKFRDNTVDNPAFTWAWRIVPRSEIVRRECPECDAVEQIPSGAFDVEVEGGRIYPDVLGCGTYPFLIVSQRVVDGWIEAGITCFRTFDVGVAKVESKELLDSVPPRYFRVEIDGRCHIDLSASGVEVVHLCPECHHLVTHPSLVQGFHMVPDSWDGCALFRDEVLYPRVNFCTQEVVDLARRHRWTNFRFEPMEGPIDLNSRGIDYLDS